VGGDAQGGSMNLRSTPLLQGATDPRVTLSPAKLQALLDSADTLASTLSLDSVLANILAIGGELTRSTAGSVILRDPQQNDLYFAAATGPAADEVRAIRIPIGKGKAGMVFETGEPIVENTIKNHYQAVDEKTHFVTESMVCVPLRFGAQTIGVLQLLNKDGGSGTYDAADLELTQRLAVQATIAIRNAALFQRLLASSGLYGHADDCSDLVAMVTGEGPRAKVERAAVLFADMRGFTRLCEIIAGNPTNIQSYLTQFFRVVAGSVLAHRGIVNKFLGDGLMAFFRGDDAPLRAVQCAFHMREEFAALRKEWQRGSSRSRNLSFLELGVGIAFDEITIGAVGDEKVSDFTLVGGAVNLSSALEHQARDGKFLLCDVDTFEAVQPWLSKFEGPIEFGTYLIYHLKEIRSATQRATVFVCHSSADIAQIRQLLIPCLEKHGFQPFLAESSIKLGDRWDQAIVTAIDACEYFMIVITKQAAKSINVSDEVYYAFEHRQKKKTNWIMPVRLEAVEPSQIHWQLGRHQYRDLTTPQGVAEFEAMLKELALAGRS
jgi:adenylate cyclase